MNLSHILYFIPDAKAPCSILYSSGNIQIKSCWVTLSSVKFSYIKLAKTSVSRGLSDVEPSEHHEETSDSFDMNQDDKFFVISN